jgi:hypothetical protein
MYPFFDVEVLGIATDTANWIANGVLALIAIVILFMLYRSISRPRMASGRRSKNARLAITDAASIDDRRRLVLVRRDNVEHLIMIGGPSDLVIESNIESGLAAQPRQTSTGASDGNSVKQPPISARSPTSASSPTPTQTPSPATATPTPTPTPPPTVAKPSVTNISVSAPATENRPSPIATGGPATMSKPIVAIPPSAKVVTTSAKPASITPEIAEPSPAGSAPQVKPASSSPPAKTTMGDDMDALLNEITTNK